MARGVNKVIIVGNLGADPEVRYMPSGSAVTTISVATSEQWTDKATGQKQERTEWHRITLFNRLAEIAGEYLKKGSQVYIEGSLRTDRYVDKNTGEDRYSTGIIASNMQLLGTRQDAQSMPRSADHQPAQAARSPSPQPVATPSQSGSAADFDDDIPFRRVNTHGESANDCLAMALSHLLLIPVQAIPRFQAMRSDCWKAALEHWLDNQGFTLHFSTRKRQGRAIGVGRRRCGTQHAIVVQDGLPYFDPDPSEAFYTSVSYYIHIDRVASLSCNTAWGSN